MIEYLKLHCVDLRKILDILITTGRRFSRHDIEPESYATKVDAYLMPSSYGLKVRNIMLLGKTATYALLIGFD